MLQTFGQQLMSRLLNAVFENDVPKIDALLGRDPRCIGDQDAFCQAIGWGCTDAAQCLMDRGADLDARDRNGNTPLQMACLSLDSSLFHELLRRGSRLQDTSELAWTAAMSGHIDILRSLHQAGVDLNEGARLKLLLARATLKPFATCSVLASIRHSLIRHIQSSRGRDQWPLKRQWRRFGSSSQKQRPSKPVVATVDKAASSLRLRAHGSR